MAYKNTSDATRHQNEYIRKTYDRLPVFATKADGQRIRSAAAEAGQSVNAFVLGCVFDKIGERDADGAAGSDDPAL